LKTNKAIKFANWIIEQGYKIDQETKLWQFQDLPFLWSTEELYKEFSNAPSKIRRNR
jgi:hypothetical protein